MILFFGTPSQLIYAVQSTANLDEKTIEKLEWLFGGFTLIREEAVEGIFIGPRASMITPWSTNATEIIANMGVESIQRVEQFSAAEEHSSFDPMLVVKHHGLSQTLFDVATAPAPVEAITNIAAYNQSEGLALSDDEVVYLEGLSKRLERPLTDSEVFGFSQVNSEHCRHKIFNGIFEIDGKAMPNSLFGMIKRTSKENPRTIVSAYKDNVAFIKGPEITQFAPQRADQPSNYEEKKRQSVLSLKAETHNFPTTVEPFNGAATGSGGEILIITIIATCILTSCGSIHSMSSTGIKGSNHVTSSTLYNG